MTTEEIKELWGEELYNVFEQHIDDEGFLTEKWANIIEDNLSDWDEDFNDTNEKKEVYGLMYNIDFEYNEDKTKIRKIN
ncbi:hypothetical protein [Myroides sp.]|uniref:hypothetical protein n=1 Tax=Myroides sp. TaxID=1874736 RepID=UPI0028A6CB05|nr:hypothetical protein [Myroides sp.]